PSLVVRPRRRARRRGRIDQSGQKFFETAQLIATHSHLRWPDLSREWIRRQQARIARGKVAVYPREMLLNLFYSLLDWESRLPCVLGPRKSRLSLFTRKQQKLLNQARKMEGVPDLSALLKGKLQMLSTTPSSAGASEARPVPVDGDANSEPPAQSSPKKKTNKVNKAKAKDGSVPLEVAPSAANVAEAAAKKKKKKGSKKRSREEASVEARETSAAARDDDAERDDPAGSTRGSPEERPKKKSKKKAAEDDGTSAPEIPSRSGETATEVGDGSRGESPSKVLRVKFEELEDKLKSDRLAKKDALREKTRLERLVASLEKEKAELEEERDAVVGTLVKERQRLRDSRVQEVTRERIKVQTAMADKSTRCIGKRTVVPEGNTIEERLDGSDPEETGDAIQTDTGDVAAEDPVLVSSSEEREGDEVGEEETRSSPALAEEVDPILPVSDPPAPVEGLGDQVVERETTEALDPSRDDQDVVTSDEPVIGFTRLSSCFVLELSKSR
ncbi:hypothetical protein HID58_018504, partial [Brassica napus]